MNPIVSVIVVAKNEEKYISACLDSLVVQDFPKDSYEIIVVDGGSKDRTPEICRSYPVKLISTGSGISHQRNVGISAAKGKYVAFTDADCIADKNWLRKLVEQAEKTDKNTVAVGGPNLVFDTDPPLSRIIGYAQETFLGSGGSVQTSIPDKSGYVDSIPNCNILYKREVVAREKYYEGLSIGDDSELNFRLRQKGYKFLYLRDAIVWHHRRASLKSFARNMFFYGEAMGRIIRKHGRIVRWYAPLSGLAVLAVIFSYPIINFFRPAIYIYAFAIASYIIALAISTTKVYQRYKSVGFLMTMILLPVQHFFYGVGFLKGLLEVRRTE